MRKHILHELSNKKLIEKALKQIEEETRFHIKDREYGSCYFIADGPKNSICHFHIKEIPGFIFAFWTTNRFDRIEDQIESGHMLWSDYYQIPSDSELVFFTQYERDIDKFKPSYSGFVTGTRRIAWDEGSVDNPIRKEEFVLHDIVNILEYMKKHPIKSYVYVGARLNHITSELSGIECLKYYINGWISYQRSYYREKFELNYLKNKSIKMLNKLSEFNYILRDYGEGCFPRLHIVIRRKENINYDEYFKQVNLIMDFEDKFFNDISLFLCEIPLDVDTLNTGGLCNSDRKEDKKLKQRFTNVMNCSDEELTSDGEIILCRKYEQGD